MEIALDKLKDLSHLLSTIQISDVADILIVTFLVYRLLLMIRSSIYKQFFKHLSSQRSLWKHTFYCMIYNILRLLSEHFLECCFFHSTNII